MAGPGIRVLLDLRETSGVGIQVAEDGVHGMDVPLYRRFSPFESPRCAFILRVFSVLAPDHLNVMASSDVRAYTALPAARTCPPARELAASFGAVNLTGPLLDEAVKQSFEASLRVPGPNDTRFLPRLLEIWSFIGRSGLATVTVGRRNTPPECGWGHGR
ncbi:hypothetical protein MAPG_04936 [Magnaporthiopsis poae ATCC 64411]|uniref:Uncharacterized protein n=1 Tax=Magnaporthiopsis poae (strain ATCC 64411 / 73-15) TaxID=644358 RepID=A0A0C4DY27_MAGP6|nr:hypothetical protein MAPG_04936 [Magnaporthiopsis poae ATCC 64411]